MNKLDAIKYLAAATAKCSAAGEHASAELGAARLLGLLGVHSIINPKRIGLLEAARDANIDMQISDGELS